MSIKRVVTCDFTHDIGIIFNAHPKLATDLGWTIINTKLDPEDPDNEILDACPLCTTKYFLIGMLNLLGHRPNTGLEQWYPWDLVTNDKPALWVEQVEKMNEELPANYFHAAVMGPPTKEDIHA